MVLINLYGGTNSVNTVTEALNIAISGDQIIIHDSNNNVMVTVNYTINNVMLMFQVNTDSDLSGESTDNGQNMSSFVVKFLHAVLEANNPIINNIKSGKNIFFSQDGNILKMGILSSLNSSINANNDYNGASVILNTNLPTNNKILVGISDTLIYNNKNQDLGFYVKQIDATNFVNTDATTLDESIQLVENNLSNKLVLSIILPTLKSDITNAEFSNKLVNLIVDPSGNYFTKPPNFINNKNAAKNFTLYLASSGMFLLLNPNHYTEYAINMLRFAQDNSNTTDTRSLRKLINANATPVEGRYNGWMYNSNSQPNYINWNLYNSSKDNDISAETLQIFWITIYQPNPSLQTLYFGMTDNNSNNVDVSCNTLNTTGRYVLYYSNNNIIPTKSIFNLLPDETEIVSYIRFNNSNIFNNNLVNLNLKTIYNNTPTSANFYLETFGYSSVNQNNIQGHIFNLATRQMFDNRIAENEQIYLSSENGFNALLNRFINPNSSYPMDRFTMNADTDNPLVDAQTEEAKVTGGIIHASQGWYFNSTTSMQLNLLENNTSFNDYHTIFIEVIIRNPTNLSLNLQLSGFGVNGINFTNLTGHQVIYIKNSPYVFESFDDKTLGAYFDALNPALQFTAVNAFLSNPPSSNSLGQLLLNIGANSDVELVSYGYKIKGQLPFQFVTKWLAEENNAMIRNIDNYLILHKDAEVDIELPQEVSDSMFSVISYGDFFVANYQQDPLNNTYGDIRVNAELNTPAVENALYVLENASLNNYTIDVGGLRYTTDAVALVDKNGNIIHKNNNVNEDYVGVLVNNKYIIADFQNGGNPNNIIESNYITTQSDGQKIFNLNGGLSPVVLEGIYAALFKEFNKSSSILNASLSSSITDNICPIEPPVPITAVLSNVNSASINNFGNNDSYDYKVTYITSDGETVASFPSNAVKQPATGSTKKINLNLPVSPDYRVIGRKIYRRKNNITDFIFLDIINNNSVILYTDDNPDPSITSISAPSLVGLNSLLLSTIPSTLISNGVYRYVITYYKVGGNQSLPSDISTPLTMPTNPCGIIINLPIYPGSASDVDGRNIYRTTSNSNNFYLVTTITNNTQTIYVDTLNDTSLINNATLAASSGTLQNVKPSLVDVGGINFVYLAQQTTSNNLTEGVYQYAYSYVTSDNGGEETNISTTFNFSQGLVPLKVLLNLPVSSDQRVVKRNIYRTIAGGNTLKLMTTINNNTSTLFIDDIADSIVNTGKLPPISNTTSSNTAPSVDTTVKPNSTNLAELLANAIREVQVPTASSTLFKLYEASGRLAKDRSVYSTDKRGGTGTNLDGTTAANTVNMNLENMEIKFKCKLHGLLFDKSGRTQFNSSALNRQLAELVFGVYYKSGESDTLVREIVRFEDNTYGFDEKNNRLEMLNNMRDVNGNFIVNKEIQYEIIFRVTLVQKTP
jgi:hypothetical protein